MINIQKINCIAGATKFIVTFNLVLFLFRFGRGGRALSQLPLSEK